MAARRRSLGLQLPGWRRDALRTSLWFVPSVLVVVAVALFVVTYLLDRAASDGQFGIPGFVNGGGPDAARTILTAIAAAVITVVGVVFSITILALQLASTQFGPRMLRNFIRDFGTQLTLGTFVATFVFSVLALGSVTNTFVPHISVTVALALLLLNLGVLIYFIHHVANSIQLTSVVHGIALDLGGAIDELHREADFAPNVAAGLSPAELLIRLDEDGLEIPASTSGYLQAIGTAQLVGIAARAEAVVQLVHRPGHFTLEGRPLAVVWPPEAAPEVARAFDQVHVIGPYRTLRQDLQFAIDQLVEIAIRALSPAVNDTFTALTCIDWLGDGVSKLSTTPLPDGISRDGSGRVRLIEVSLAYERVLDRAFDKVRQAGRGMPAVGIRQLENLSKVAEYTIDEPQRAAIERQAEMIGRSSEAIPEPNDRDDLERSARQVLAALERARRAGAPRSRPSREGRAAVAAPSRWH